MPMFEPICAGILVSLIDKYVLNNLEHVWKFFGCQETSVSQDDSMEESQTKDGEEESIEHEAVSSERTTITSGVQVHCHHC